jgi:hypothetical protein
MDKIKLRQLLDDHRLYHSEFQMDHSITESHGGTAYGCYVQALRELFRRWRALKELHVSRETLLNQIAEAEEQTRDSPEATHLKERIGPYRFRELEIELMRHRMNIEDLELNIRETQREFARFYAQAEKLKKVVGPLTPDRRRELDQELWRHRFGVLVAIEVHAGQLSQNTLELLATCPPTWRASFLREAFDLIGVPRERQENSAAWHLVQRLGDDNYSLDMPALEGNGQDVQALLEGDG